MWRAKLAKEAVRAAHDVRARAFRFDGGTVLVLSFPLTAPLAPATLTAAERAIAEQVLRGATNAQIATRRGRSVNTVNKQIASVFRKLGVRSRLELARVFRAPAVRQVAAADGLSPDERLLVLRRARGDALKEIAIDLGLSISTISRRLTRAMHKLGVESEIDLPRLFAADERND